MPKKLSTAILLLLLLIVAVVSWQWVDERNVDPAVQNAPIEMAENQSDYYLEEFEILNVSNEDSSANAARNVKITGKSLSHHYIEGYSLIEKPQVVLLTADKEYWQANAARGTVSADFDVLRLRGDVQLTHHEAGDTPGQQLDKSSAITVDTESLSIDTTQRVIETKDQVVAHGTGWQYTANSMRADIDSGTLSFTSGVEAQYANPNNQ